MRHRTFAYSALVFSAFAIFLGWIEPITAKFGHYTPGFWLGVLPLLGILLIVMGPVGTALVPNADERVHILGRLAGPYVLYLVLYTLVRVYIVATGPITWTLTGVLYLLALVSLWLIEQHHAK
ncbi:hypothetical protein [Lacticaseibacillus thailandensis]|uniref:Uncharacterized protein n=1 Tax=Lacticaseibacillus thailandensis DSM 22698 = JCM 13996 TaxID=1423810 RepID=A0A0R2C3U2_9LACO|nr:hypothetical protein [Lacticaseibacillus thailandensis]KRM86559.1 hypothetical protein FD19_GL001872 [Lacticaseibacillus thailandensis DSM 22698 = JCM 13996]